MEKLKEMWEKFVSMEFECPYCGKPFQFKVTEWNTRRRCPQCKKAFKVQMTIPAIALLLFVGFILFTGLNMVTTLLNIDFCLVLIAMLLLVNLYATVMYKLMIKVFKKELVFKITLLKEKKDARN